MRRQIVLLRDEPKLELVDSLQRIAQVLVFLQGFASATGLINRALLDLFDSLSNPVIVHWPVRFFILIDLGLAAARLSYRLYRALFGDRILDRGATILISEICL